MVLTCVNIIEPHAYLLLLLPSKKDLDDYLFLSRTTTHPDFAT